MSQKLTVIKWLDAWLVIIKPTHHNTILFIWKKRKSITYAQWWLNICGLVHDQILFFVNSHMKKKRILFIHIIGLLSIISLILLNTTSIFIWRKNIIASHFSPLLSILQWFLPCRKSNLATQNCSYWKLLLFVLVNHLSLLNLTSCFIWRQNIIVKSFFSFLCFCNHLILTLQEIRKRGLKVAVAGIPKTIDNDIPVFPTSPAIVLN